MDFTKLDAVYGKLKKSLEELGDDNCLKDIIKEWEEAIQCLRLVLVAQKIQEEEDNGTI